jgi:periplasmic protein TonB
VKEEPPTVAELKVADPGQKDIKGDPNADIVIDEPVGNSDQKAVTEDVNKVYDVVEVLPQFPGGLDKFGAYLAKTIKYPAVDRENNLQGKVVMQFVVERDGSLTDIKAIRGPSEAMKEEAIRVLRGSPKWKPGIQNGRPVRAQYTVPINFQLGEE